MVIRQPLVTSGDKDLGRETYKSQPIRVGIRLHELVDITFHHPLRYNHEPILRHCSTQKR